MSNTIYIVHIKLVFHIFQERRMWKMLKTLKTIYKAMFTTQWNKFCQEFLSLKTYFFRP